MIYLGLVLTALGFGSAWLASSNSTIQFKYLAWADPMQPWIGILLGVIGIAIVVWGIMNTVNKAKAARAEQQARNAGPVAGDPRQAGGATSADPRGYNGR